MNNTKIAWLLPVAWFYWQPTLSEFTKAFPKTTIFTALFPGYTKGYENSLNLEIIGKFKIFRDREKISQSKYGSGFTYLSPKVIQPLLKLKPQIVFTSSFGVWTLLALLFKPLGGWKVVLAYEGSSPGVDFLNSPFRLWIRQQMVKGANAYLTNTQKGKKYLVDVLQAPKEKVFAHPYEIPDAKSLLDEDEKRSYDISSSASKPIFLFVGRLIPRKGLLLLLKACLHLQNQGRDNYSLLVVGDGEQREELETFCQVNNLNNIVQWHGRVDSQHISSYFKAADVFVLPTLEDTWGVVIPEAMLLGKPIL